MSIQPFTKSPPVHAGNPTDSLFTRDGVDVDRVVQMILYYGAPVGVDPASSTFFVQDEHGAWTLDEHGMLVERRIRDLLGSRQTRRHVSEVKSAMLANHPDVPIVEVAANERGIPFTNGMLDIETGTLVEVDGLVNRLDVAYDPAAACPKFDEWLAGRVDPDVVPLVWEAIGYSLLAGNPLQRAFLLYGRGGDGKGTLLRVLAAMWRREDVAALSLQEMGERFMPVTLLGKALNVCGDLDARRVDNTGAFKKATGRDPIQGERKGQQPFTFTVYATPYFASNVIPSTSDASEGYFRRWVLIPFDRPIPVAEHDYRVEDALLAERSAIASKAAGHLRKLMARRTFTTCDAVEALVHDFRTMADSVSSWLDERTDPLPGRFATTADLYSDYREFCDDSGVPAKSRNSFTSALRSLGFDRVKATSGSRQWGVTGLRLRPPGR